MADSQVQGLGFSPEDLAGNQELQIALVSRFLAERFGELGSWQKVLSEYGGGGPDGFQSPTSPVGGFVNSVLGIASSQANYGMAGLGGAGGSIGSGSGYIAATRFLPMAQDFHKAMQ